MIPGTTAENTLFGYQPRTPASYSDADADATPATSASSSDDVATTPTPTGVAAERARISRGN
jgi:hypothetical protein